MSYATSAEYLAWTKGSTPSSGEAALIQLDLDAAAEAINEHCRRDFTAATSATSGARSYTVQAGQTHVFVDDHVAGTATLTVNGVAVDVTPVHPSNGRPATTLVGDFCLTSANVAVTAEWGWPATPAAVITANLLLAAKLDQRRQSPNGVERGGDEIGFIRILGVDKDVQELLRPFVRVARSFA